MNRKKINLKPFENNTEKDSSVTKLITPVGCKRSLSGLSVRKKHIKKVGLSHSVIKNSDLINLPTDFKISYVLRGKVHNVHISSTSLEQTFNQSLQKALLDE